MVRLMLPLLLVVLAVGVLAWWGLVLQRSRDRYVLGMRGSKKKMRALQSENTRMRTTLTEVRDVAEASASPLTRDPAFDLILDKIDMALEPRKDKQ